MKDFVEILKKENKYITQQQFCNKTGLTGYFSLGENFHDSTERHALTNIIHKHNADPEAEGIIISNSKGIKIATEEEARKFIERQYISIFKKLKYIRKIDKKIDKDGQYSIFNKLYEEFKKD